jgi:hypothetical protein
MNMTSDVNFNHVPHASSWIVGFLSTTFIISSIRFLYSYKSAKEVSLDFFFEIPQQKLFADDEKIGTIQSNKIVNRIRDLVGNSLMYRFSRF